ncbi:MAG: PqqD family protein [Syntrophales bacterium]
MKIKAYLDACYIPSEDVIAREVEGELIIVPLFTEEGDDELFSVNDTGKAVWERLSRKKSLRTVLEELRDVFDAANGRMEKDVIDFIEELLNKKFLVEVPRR